MKGLPPLDRPKDAVPVWMWAVFIGVVFVSLVTLVVFFWRY
jgi:hypothetical protein